MEGSTDSAGHTLDWAVRAGFADNLEELSKLANSDISDEHMYFVPAFYGISNPINDPSASAVAIGMTHNTKKNDFVKAILESTGFRATQILDALYEDTNLYPTDIYVDGNASKCDYMLDFLSRVSKCKIHRPYTLEMTSLGAAFLAGVASGFWTQEELADIRKVDAVFDSKLEEEELQYRKGKFDDALQRSLKWNEMAIESKSNFYIAILVLIVVVILMKVF
eukprot:TRINITY_DN2289_c0_g1_i2.p1 TRINITY_DN2289_c0_g1~~TRINITY_DN2289_c0_g1_i2.p1  ORF type:complete len:222 (-),score=54.52 TRINITY_DN2289_c0_g1_i2:2-667(-)